MLETLKSKLAGAWKSWTIWANGTLGTIAAALLPLLPTLRDALQENLPQLQPYLPPPVLLWGVVLLAGMNVALRFKTNSALENK